MQTDTFKGPRFADETPENIMPCAWDHLGFVHMCMSFNLISILYLYCIPQKYPLTMVNFFDETTCRYGYKIWWFIWLSCHHPFFCHSLNVVFFYLPVGQNFPASHLWGAVLYVRYLPVDCIITNVYTYICPAVTRSVKWEHNNKNWAHRTQKHLLVLPTRIRKIQYICFWENRLNTSSELFPCWTL